jgi:hypothetical protein
VGKVFSDHLRASRRLKVTTQDPPVINKPVVNPDVVTSIESQTLEDSHVYVHCHFSNNEQHEMMVRVWSTTFLVDNASGASSTLIHAENVSMAPQWTVVPSNSLYSFLLIFSALPKACQRFDFREDIPQPGGFLVTDIPRNEKDVYHIDLL